MRHGKKNNHLGRTASHRKSLLSNLANSLILNKRIVTTLAKAKELRKYVEPILTKSKDDSTHNRRTVFAYLKNKEAIKALFGDISEKIANRNGGYTRIIKLGTRAGDAAETAMIELVDYNELLLAASAEKPAKTRRSRRSSGKAGTAAASGVAAATETMVHDSVDSVIADAVVEEEISDIQSTPAEDIAEQAEEDSGTENSPVAETSAEEAASETVSGDDAAESEESSAEENPGQSDAPAETPDDETKPEA